MLDDYQVENLKTNLRSYLESQGINTSRHFKCINPEHYDSNASMKYFDDNKVYCFGCGASYNLFDVISVIEKVDNKEAFKRAIKYYSNGYTVPQQTIFKKEPEKENVEKNYEKAYIFWQKNLKNNYKAQKYLKSRGIDMKTAERFFIGYNEFNIEKFKLNAIIIPTSQTSFTARNIEEGEIRYYKTKNCHTKLFNTEALTNNKPYCVLTEGEFDCLSFETIGVNCAALCSVNNISKFKETEISKDKTYILALDNDSAGEKATQELVDYFNENGIFYTTFDNCGYKDANQALVTDRKQFENSIKNIVETLTGTKYRKNYAEM